MANQPPAKPLSLTRRQRIDAELRRAGFTIHARSACGEPVWRRGKVTYGESEALALAKEMGEKVTSE